MAESHSSPRGYLFALWQCVVDPVQAFHRRASEEADLGRMLRRLVLVRTPPALVGWVLAYAGLATAYQKLFTSGGTLWHQIPPLLPESVSPEDLKALVQTLPALPPWPRMLPWFVVLAPLGVLSLWLHDAVWDHLALWMLGGVDPKSRFRATLLADAEALEAGAFGAVAGLLKYLPPVGCLVQVLLLPVAVYFWILRGFALAARHGCPLWKGITATLLHVLLVVLFFGGTVLLGVIVMLRF